MALQAEKNSHATLADLIDKILDKGLIINADIAVSVAGVELLGVKIRAAISSFETAAQYGLEFPSGINHNTEVWKKAKIDKETCPKCGKRAPVEELLSVGCPWCGWISAQVRKTLEAK